MRSDVVASDRSTEVWKALPSCGRMPGFLVCWEAGDPGFLASGTLPDPGSDPAGAGAEPEGRDCETAVMNPHVPTRRRRGALVLRVGGGRGLPA